MRVDTSAPTALSTLATGAASRDAPPAAPNSTGPLMTGAPGSNLSSRGGWGSPICLVTSLPIGVLTSWA